MITATGNNFGAYTIQLKDYQSDKIIILNGRVVLDPTNEDYIAAKQLEIYVPDLSIPKSTTTAVFQQGMSWSRPMVTALKSWIKNKNTIVVEKPIVLKSAAAEPELMFFCAYVPKGVRFTPEGMTPTPLTIENASLLTTSIALSRITGCIWRLRSAGPRRRRRARSSVSGWQVCRMTLRRMCLSSSTHTRTRKMAATRSLSTLRETSLLALE